MPQHSEEEVLEWMAKGLVTTTGHPVHPARRGSVIGAGSVVSREVPAMVVAVGAPCRVLRERGEEDLRTRDTW